MMDFSFKLIGPLIVSGETCVYLDWPKKLRIPVYVKAICQNMVARVRLKYSARDHDDNWMQWIGKPQVNLSLEPIIGENFDLKRSLPMVKQMLDQFVASKMSSFEKIPVEVPLGELPEFVNRYTLFEAKKMEDKSTQANIRDLILS